ncbi:hypothetical protein Back11_05560 [Paenibacillus baekrokdamisoli]|uniref:Uncharacterized protein n=1 Tax=Paenibacillus baekrokdamisoli TaxID=1712516 RepID=A0A3G9IZZ2_9BACL|nr:hypothetical protein Back11_05560 [Paenibacillus baekrokdamisoli]
MKTGSGRREDLPDKAYTFSMTYEGTYMEKAQNTGPSPIVVLACLTWAPIRRKRRTRA